MRPGCLSLFHKYHTRYSLFSLNHLKHVWGRKLQGSYRVVRITQPPFPSHPPCILYCTRTTIIFTAIYIALLPPHIDATSEGPITAAANPFWPVIRCASQRLFWPDASVWLRCTIVSNILLFPNLREYATGACINMDSYKKWLQLLASATCTSKFLNGIEKRDCTKNSFTRGCIFYRIRSIRSCT